MEGDKMSAYDYGKQVWVDGPEGDELGARQDAEHAELLNDPAYRRFIGLDK